MADNLNVNPFFLEDLFGQCVCDVYYGCNFCKNAEMQNSFEEADRKYILEFQAVWDAADNREEQRPKVEESLSEEEANMILSEAHLTEDEAKEIIARGFIPP
jgi:hypothetical protein